MNLLTNQKFKMQFISPTTFFLWGVPFIYLFLNATASSSFSVTSAFHCLCPVPESFLSEGFWSPGLGREQE